MSLRYLDEFVGLKCAPALLTHKVSSGALPTAAHCPNPSHPSLSTAVSQCQGDHRVHGGLHSVPGGVLDILSCHRTPFNALCCHHCRQFISSRDIALGAEDAVVCVGDGATPRTAALFALRLPCVQCYSVDPALAEQTRPVAGAEKGVVWTDIDSQNGCVVAGPVDRNAHSELLEEGAQQVSVKMPPLDHPWTCIERLHLMPFKIENVRLRCARAVVVLLHAHVSLADVRRAISGAVVGVIAVPCCNFGPVQEAFHGCSPDHTFEDPYMLSAKNEVRVWSPTALEAIIPVPDTSESVSPSAKGRALTKAATNTLSRRKRDQLRVRLLQLAPTRRQGPSERVLSSPFSTVRSTACEASKGSLFSTGVSSVGPQDAGGADGAAAGAQQRVDLDLVQRLRDDVATQCASTPEGGVHSCTDGDAIIPVMRVLVAVKGKKYESAFMLILAVEDPAPRVEGASQVAPAEMQVIVSKKSFPEGQFDSMRDSIRPGDVLEAVGVPGRTSFGDPALFAWELCLVRMVLPFDVIYAASSLDECGCIRS